MNIVIIGGVAAGAKAAAKAKRLLPSAKVTIYTQDNHVSYSSCGLPYYIQGNFEDYRTLLVRSPEEFKAAGIDVFLNSCVEKILPDKKQVLVRYVNGIEYISYDKLIIATGARPFIPDIEGLCGVKNVFTLRTIEDGIIMRKSMLNSKRAVIIGSGYIGLELLEAFVRNNVFVSVIERSQHIMSIFDSEISDLIRKRIDTINNGNFEFITGERVEKFDKNGDYVYSITASGGREILTDMVVICAGVRPNTEIAKDAGIEIGVTGAIKVNKLMATSIENIYACGDCAEKKHIVSGHNVWIPLGSTANKEGRCAAMNACGVYCEFEGVLGSAVSRCLNTTMSKTGLTEKEAKAVGFTPISITVEKTDKVAFMPETSDITLKVIADEVTGLLLGGQAIGSFGADKRINSLTAGLLGHLTVEEFSHNDLTYSPPYSTTIDPLLNAAEILAKKIRTAHLT